MRREADDAARAQAWAGLAAFLLIAHQITAKALRDALFLSHFPVATLPRAMVAGALFSSLMVLILAHAMGRFGPQRTMPFTLLLSATLFFGEWYLLAWSPTLTAVLVYLHVAGFGAVLISGFWSQVNERFDPHSARQRIARITAAATLGGLIGGLMAQQTGTRFGLPVMLLLLGTIHLLCAAAIWRVTSGTAAGGVESGVVRHPGHGLALLRRHPYLRGLAMLAVLAGFVAALLDYAFKAQVKAAYPEGEAMVGFFALFYAGIGLLTFLVQGFFGQRLLSRLGGTATLAVLPGFLCLGGLVAAALNFLWSATLLRGGQMVLGNSLFRSAFEQLYSPLPGALKRPTKALIDVGGDRLGDILGGGLIILLLWLLPALPPGLLFLLAVLAAVAMLWLLGRLSGGYVEQLGARLQDGAGTLAGMQGGAEPVADGLRTGIFASVTALRALDPREPDALLSGVSDLLSGDRERIQRVLEQDPLDTRLVPMVIPLLEVPGLEYEVIRALRRVVATNVGQLTDALLLPDQSPVVRRRLPLVLEDSSDGRAAEGLCLGLEDTSFEVRYRCALALSRVLERNPALHIGAERLFRAALREIREQADDWREHGVLEGEGEQRRPKRGFRHVFTLLGLALEPEVMQLAMLSLFSGDPRLRGTALEYLDNTLPSPVRDAIWPFLGERRARSRRRHAGELAADLLRAAGFLLPQRGRILRGQRSG